MITIRNFFLDRFLEPASFMLVRDTLPGSKSVEARRW